MSRRRSRFCYMTVFPLLFVCGCGGGGDDPNSYQVSGNVTWQGEPIPAGFITFEPDASQGTQGPAGGAKIKQGHYQTPPGKGIVGGAYIVKVRGYDGIKVENDLGMAAARGTPLFPEKTLKSEFPSTDTTRDFHLPANESK